MFPRTNLLLSPLAGNEKALPFGSLDPASDAGRKREGPALRVAAPRRRTIGSLLDWAERMKKALAKKFDS